MLKTRHRIWTEDEDRKLVEMRAAGRSPISIANALKRTRGAVNARMNMLRQQQVQDKPLPQRKWTADEDYLLIELKGDGLLVATIAKQFDRTEAAVSDRLILLKKRGLLGLLAANPSNVTRRARTP